MIRKRFLEIKLTPIYALLFLVPTPMPSLSESSLTDADSGEEQVVFERKLGRILNASQAADSDLPLLGQQAAMLDQLGASALRWTIGPIPQEGSWQVIKPTHVSDTLMSLGLREIYLKKGTDSYEILVESMSKNGQWSLVERRRVQKGNPDIKVQRAISSL